jgi:DNA-binding beta-propeller fold protein YncE
VSALAGAALGVLACAGGAAHDRAGTAASPTGAGTTSSAAGPASALATPGPYVVYVANESSDAVSAVEIGANGAARVRREIPVGLMPGDIDGAHGLQASPDGRYWYLTIAHGQPFGTVWKFDARADTLIARTEVGMFPATMGISHDGDYLFVVNFNLHGDPEPSTVSVVHTPSMTELTRTPACVRPHGSRVSPDGMTNYVACVGGDQVVAIDTRSFEVRARFSVAPGREGRLSEGDAGVVSSACAPTWVTPGVGVREGMLYVPCNRTAEVLEIDARRWVVTRRFATGAGPYNLDITPDGGTLVATLKSAQQIAVFDLTAGTERERLATSQPVTHGVAISPDGRYAFVTNESIGATPGTLDVFDLGGGRLVATAILGLQAGGIALVRSE